MKTCTQPYEVNVLGKPFIVYPRVFCPASDTKLLINTMQINAGDKVLEVCAGTGVISVFAAETAREVIAIDVNPDAIININANAKLHGLECKINAINTNIFPERTEKFHGILINPPYTNHVATDVVEQSCWDFEHALLKRFLLSAPTYLKEGGRIYASWASFANFSFFEFLASKQYQVTLVGSDKNSEREYRVYRLILKQFP